MCSQFLRRRLSKLLILLRLSSLTNFGPCRSKVGCQVFVFEDWHVWDNFCRIHAILKIQNRAIQLSNPVRIQNIRFGCCKQNIECFWLQKWILTCYCTELEISNTTALSCEAVLFQDVGEYPWPKQRASHEWTKISKYFASLLVDRLESEIIRQLSSW